MKQVRVATANPVSRPITGFSIIAEDAINDMADQAGIYNYQQEQAA